MVMDTHAAVTLPPAVSRPLHSLNGILISMTPVLVPRPCLSSRKFLGCANDTFLHFGVTLRSIVTSSSTSYSNVIIVSIFVALVGGVPFDLVFLPPGCHSGHASPIRPLLLHLPLALLPKILFPNNTILFAQLG